LKRFVIDANILVSGSVDPHGESPPSLLYANLAGALFEAVLSRELLEEVADALGKPYFVERIGEAAVADIVGGIAEAATILEDPPPIEVSLRDPGDDYLIALAREAGAEAIVTGDRDLLEHDGLEPPAITARAACELLGLVEPTERP